MNWVMVKDLLPEECIPVLTLDYSNPDFPLYKVDYMVEMDDGYIWARTIGDEWNKVTHWMSLPEPPKPQS